MTGFLEQAEKEKNEEPRTWTERRKALQFTTQTYAPPLFVIARTNLKVKTINFSMSPQM